MTVRCRFGYSLRAVLVIGEVAAGLMTWSPGRPGASIADPATMPARRAAPATAVARAMTAPAVTAFIRGDPG